MKTQTYISLILISIIFASAPIVSSKSLPNTKWIPEVKGIKLGSSLKQVISVFKKPGTKREKTEHTILQYEGLTIEINKKSLNVSRIEVFSSKWEIHPEIKVEMLKDEAYKILGNPLHSEERGSQIYVWWWHANPNIDSLFLVVFENKKIIRVILAEDHSI